LDIDSRIGQVVDDPPRARIDTQAHQQHSRVPFQRAACVREFACVPVGEILDLFDALLVRIVLDEPSELLRLARPEVRDVVEDLCDCVPGERTSLELEQYEPAVLVDAEEIQRASLDGKLASDQGQAVE
jgi:hypothetical protein